MINALILLFVLALGLWCAYLPFRSLKTGYIKYKGWTYERRNQPFWFWFYLITSGVIGVGLIVSVIYLVIVRLNKP